MTTTLTSTGVAVDAGSIQINGSSQIYTPNYGWLHDCFFHTLSNCAVNAAGAGNCVTNCTYYGDSVNLTYGSALFDDGGQLRLNMQRNYQNCNCNC
jgi:hypothetical protein